MTAVSTAPSRLEPAPSGVLDRLRRRWHGTHRVDPWGLDVDVADLAVGLAGLRAAVGVTGTHDVPATGGALVVANRGVDPAWMLALLVALRRAGRVPRLVGAPDVEPLGPILRRTGVVAAHPDEVASLLQAGELVVVPLRPRWGGRAGGLAPDLVAPAVQAGSPIVPVAVSGREGGIRYAVRVGPPVAPSGGPAVGEAADAARRGIQDLLGR